MSKSETLHKLYEECKAIDFYETHDLEKNAASEEEADFIRIISDFVLQHKQKKAISEKRF